MSAVRALARVGLTVALAAVVYGLTFALVFLYSSSPQLLAWLPSLSAAAAIAAVLRPARRRSVPGRVAAGVVATVLIVLFIGAAVLASGALSRRPAATPAPATALDGYVPTRDGALFFHQTAPAGDPRPVVLVLHGGPGSGSVGVRAALEGSLGAVSRVVFFDQRGVGRSSAVSSFALDDYLDDLERLRLALKVDRWYLFGVSWGAALADEYAVRHPGQVRGVVTWGGLVANQEMTRSMLRALHAYYAANGDDAGVAWCQSLEDQISPYSRWQSLRVMNAVNRTRLKTVLTEQAEAQNVRAARMRATRDWGYSSTEAGGSLWAGAATFMAMQLESYDFEPRLRDIRVPYMFLVGEHDPLVKFIDVDAQARDMTSAAVRRVAGSGHTLDRPEAIVSAIAEFIRGSDQGSGHVQDSRPAAETR